MSDLVSDRKGRIISQWPAIIFIWCVIPWLTCPGSTLSLSTSRGGRGISRKPVFFGAQQGRLCEEGMDLNDTILNNKRIERFKGTYKWLPSGMTIGARDLKSSMARMFKEIIVRIFHSRLKISRFLSHTLIFSFCATAICYGRSCMLLWPGCPIFKLHTVWRWSKVLTH